MWEKIKKQKTVTLLILVGAVYFFLKFLSPLFAPLLVAMLFVTIFGPLLKKIQKKFHVHRQIGATVLLLIAGSLITVLLWLLFSWIVGSLPELTQKLDTLEQHLGESVHGICVSVGHALGTDSTYLETLLLGCLEQGIDYLQKDALSGVLSQSLEYAGKIAGAAVFLATFVISAVLLAKDYDRIMNWLIEREECHVFLEVICGVIRYIATFVKAQLLIMAANGALAAFVLAVTGIENGALWGLLAGFLDVFPFVGTGIVLIPLALAQLSYGHPGQAAVCVILLACCAFLREILEPRLIGKRVGIPALAVLAGVYAGIQLFGVWGIIKGPLGFMIIYRIWYSLYRKNSLKEA